MSSWQRSFPPSVTTVTRTEPIRIWVPGCASGEEAYSIAIVLLEHSVIGLPTFPCRFSGRI